MKALALTVRFLLELAAFAAVAVWGWQVVDPQAAKLVLSIAAPAVLIVVWGLFVAPKARFPVADPWWLAIEVVVFAVAALALIAIDDTIGAVVLAVVYVLDVAALFALGERRRADAVTPGEPDASCPPTHP
jgi:hypothetical protein